MKKRNSLFLVIAISVPLIFIARLFFLQIILFDKNQNLLNRVSIKRIYAYPDRGIVYDRNGKLLITNQVSYELTVTPIEVKPFDTIVLCKLLKVNKDYLIKKLDEAKRYSPWLPFVFLNYISKKDCAFLQEKIYRFKGFSIQRKSIRNYPHSSSANVLGYINQVDENLHKKDPYYKQGEFVGIQGIEKQYEKLLRGTKGVSYKFRNRLNRIIGPYKNGIYDTLPIPGNDISLTIDLDLQKYGELLMQNKRGAIVAIEPSSGEILALVNAPCYDPNLMIGREKTKNFKLLFNDSINKPLFDRTLQATYPPGSTFKVIQALIGLQSNVISPKTTFYCHGGYKYGPKKENFMSCHCNIFKKPIHLELAIEKSCNSYFSNTFVRLIEKYPSPQEGVSHWYNHLKSFGFGNYLGYDLPIGRKGFIPSYSYYDKIYNKSWKYNTIISNAIGQGEILTTPIQLANMTTIIANRGFYYTPHFLKKINDDLIHNETFHQKKLSSIESKHFKSVIEGMHKVYKSGTARFIKINEIDVCGKTGTAQNFIIKNNIRFELKDHSIFIAFAPKDNPKIALSVFVENGGYGATIAAPIASLMIEKYLINKNSLSNLEKRVINTSLNEEYNKHLLLSLENSNKNESNP